MALLLDGRPGPWLRVATLPTLVALGAGKLATVLGGTGQGLPTSGEPATAYLGPGPWGSLGPAIPSIPSQALEATRDDRRDRAHRPRCPGAGAPPAGRPAVPRRPSATWAVGRAIVATTWRDPVVAGPLRAEQVIALVVAAGALALAVMLIATRRGPQPAVDEPAWPERERATEPPRA